MPDLYTFEKIIDDYVCDRVDFRLGFAKLGEKLRIDEYCEDAATYKKSQLKYIIAAWPIVRKDLYNGKLVAYRLDKYDKIEPIAPIVWAFLNLDIETGLFTGGGRKYDSLAFSYAQDTKKIEASVGETCKAPGRPNLINRVEQELKRRIKTGAVNEDWENEMNYLHDWYSATLGDPKEAIQLKTIKSKITRVRFQKMKKTNNRRHL